MRDWFAIETVTGKEQVVIDSISAAGLSVFVPRVKVMRPYCGTYRERIEGFFKGYGFVEFDPLEEFRLVRWARGVRGVLDFGGGPVAVSYELLEDVMQHTDGEGFVNLKQRRLDGLPTFEQGEHVEIFDGPFGGHSGIYESDYKGDRALVLLCILGGQRVVEVDRLSMRPSYA